jgi:DMSO/TMAO reductase YedYZ molybdopterin-dependent catalytic subunit
MSDALTRLITRAVTRLVEERAETLRSDGRLARRDFMRLLSLGVVAPLVAACSAPGGEKTQQLLNAVGKRNERLERWLLKVANGRDRVSPRVRSAGEAFPSYFVSDTVPMWDPAARGAWALVVDGAVRTPLRLTLPELTALGMRTQRVNHYCVEGWNAVAKFQGVPFTTLARMARPTANAGYVDFASFDKDYHESWDVESAMHPQTMVVLAKDGRMLSPRYGAPARVHSPIKLGYKNTKYLTRITFLPAPNGGYWSDEGYEWFGGT